MLTRKTEVEHTNFHQNHQHFEKKQNPEPKIKIYSLKITSSIQFPRDEIKIPLKTVLKIGNHPKQNAPIKSNPNNQTHQTNKINQSP